MRILIYEHLSSGAFHDRNLNAAVLCEGYGMLNSLASEFKSQAHNVTVLLDYRLAKSALQLKADKVILVSERHLPILKETISTVDATLVIAPESEDNLKSIVSIVENSSVQSLNCSSEAIGVLSNKDLVYDRLKNHGITMPQTTVFYSKNQIKEIKKVIKQEFNFPVIIKPAVGESCSGIIKIKKYDQIENAVEKVTNNLQMKILVQEYVEGINASVSLISNGKNSQPISLNYQDIDMKSSNNCSKYKGGITPLEHPLKMKAFETAKKVANVFDGIKGYVGLDLIIADDKVFFLEINPRPTTSLIGVRKTIRENLGNLIIEACLEKNLPNYINSKGISIFSKRTTFLKNRSSFEKSLKIREIISPPFMIGKNSFQCAMIQTEGNTFEEAYSKFSKIEEKLDNLS